MSNWKEKMMSRIKKYRIVFVAISCIILLIALIKAVKYSDGTLSEEEKRQQYREILDLLIKNTPQKSFVSFFEHGNISHCVTNDNNMQIILFKNGLAGFKDGNLHHWFYKDNSIKISSSREDILEKMKHNRVSVQDVVKFLGMPSVANYDEEGNLTFTYIFLRDENAKRTDGTYNADLTLLFEKNRFHDYSFSVIHSLNQKSFSELFL